VAAGLDDINEEITRIETLVEKEKLGDSLQDAIAERERALDGLNSLMEKNTSSITGYLILKHLKEKTKEGNRPMLFHRANIIFNKITNVDMSCWLMRMRAAILLLEHSILN